MGAAQQTVSEGSMSEQLTAEQAVQRAYLEAAPPEVVYNWLKAKAPRKSEYESTIPEAILQALHARNEPIINLGLAQFTTDRALLEALYREGNVGLRCAVLSNRFFGAIFADIFNRGLFQSLEEFRTFLQESPYEIVEAYFTNPSLHPRQLEALFKREGIYESIPDDQWRFLVSVAGQNLRLHRDFVPERFVNDGWEHYEHGTPITAAWSLLERVPVTAEWAAALCRVFEKLIYNGVPREILVPPEDLAKLSREDFGEHLRPIEIAFFREVLQRWTSPDEDASSLWTHFGTLRRLIASKTPQYDDDLKGLLRDHSDIYVRQGYYESFEPLDPAEVQTAYERDKKHFIEAAIENPWFYCKGHKNVRRLLYRLVYDDKILKDTDAELVRIRYHALGESLAKEAPQVYEFDELDLERESDDKEEERTSWDRKPSLAEVGELLHETFRPRPEGAGEREAVTRLHEVLKKFQEYYEKRFQEAEASFTERLERFMQEDQSRWQVLFLMLIIGFVLVLYFK